MEESRYKEKAIKRLMSKVEKRGDCWIFRGTRNEWGYGISYFRGKVVKAHRLAKHLFENFDLFSDLQILHKDDICKSRACCNPAHTYVGTVSDNARDRHRAAKLKI